MFGKLCSCLLQEEGKSIWKGCNIIRKRKLSLFGLHFNRIAVIRREAAKIWPGNQEIYFKQNPTNNLKLEELTEKLTGMCSVEEIGFGKGKWNALIEIKSKLSRFLACSILLMYHLNWLFVPPFFLPKLSVPTFCSGRKRRTGGFQTAMILT